MLDWIMWWTYWSLCHPAPLCRTPPGWSHRWTGWALTRGPSPTGRRILQPIYLKHYTTVDKIGVYGHYICFCHWKVCRDHNSGKHIEVVLFFVSSLKYMIIEKRPSESSVNDKIFVTLVGLWNPLRERNWFILQKLLPNSRINYPHILPNHVYMWKFAERHTK